MELYGEEFHNRIIYRKEAGEILLVFQTFIWERYEVEHRRSLNLMLSWP